MTLTKINETYRANGFLFVDHLDWTISIMPWNNNSKYLQFEKSHTKIIKQFYEALHEFVSKDNIIICSQDETVIFTPDEDGCFPFEWAIPQMRAGKMVQCMDENRIILKIDGQHIIGKREGECLRKELQDWTPFEIVTEKFKPYTE